MSDGCFGRNKLSRSAMVFVMLAGMWISAEAQADIIVDAAKIIREKPATLNGTNINAHVPNFATNGDGIHYQEDLKAARVKMIRTVMYPDIRKPDHAMDYFDRNIRKILECGATPLMIQYIKPGLAYYTEDGAMGSAANPASVESNIVHMVKHYMAPPFNLKTQYWEVGNEPDYPVDWKISAEEYSDQFNRVHQALVKAGLRNNVILCGPVVANMYFASSPKPHPINAYIDTFLDRCSASVDIISMHTYAHFGAPHDELLGLTRIDKFDGRMVTDRPHTQNVRYDGFAALLAKMDTIQFGRPHVGVALTEYGAVTHKQPLTGGLWNLATTQVFQYNPRGEVITSYVFDGFGGEPDTLTHYSKDKKKNYLYWALWIAGNLRGDTVLSREVTGNAMKDGRPNLVVGATRNGDYLYIEVINRSYDAIKDKVVLKNAHVEVMAQVHKMAEGITPENGVPTQLSNTFEYEFPGSSATVFKLVLKK